MYCAGLTGGIGSGKSTVASILMHAGAALIDLDAISRQLTAPKGAAIAAVRDLFGAEMIDAQGGLDRAAMRALMLKEPQAKAQLEAVMHPLIGQEVSRQRTVFEEQERKLCVIDIPLLAESGSAWRTRVDAVWLVDCEESTQIDRVRARNAWSDEQIKAMLRLQASRALRRSMADLVWFNEGLDLEQLKSQVLSNIAQFGL